MQRNTPNPNTEMILLIRQLYDALRRARGPETTRTKLNFDDTEAVNRAIEAARGFIDGC